MQIKLFSYTLALFLIFPFLNIKSQDETSWEKTSIENQFNYLLEKSSRYEDFKVVKQTSFYALKAHVVDTLKSMRKQMHEVQHQMALKQSQIDTLKSTLLSTSNDLSDISKTKNNISFLGISMGKHVYNSFTWTIIGGLALCLIVFILLFRRSNLITSETKLNLVETKEEFEAFRKRALEREGQMARKHLDELNKYKK